MKIAIIRFKQQNPLGHYSEDQGSTESQIQNYKSSVMRNYFNTG